MATINVEIVSAEREIFSGEAEMVVASAEAGDVGIAPGHAAFISRLRPGEIRVLNGGQEEAIFVTGGVLEVQPRLVTVLADTAARSDELDESQAEEARKRAQELMAGGGEVDLATAQSQLAEANARIQFIRRLKGKGSGIASQ